MDSAGLCDICSKNQALYSCMLCGKRVCTDCVTVQGVCKHCAGGKSISEDKRTVTDRVFKDSGMDARLR